MSFHRNGIVTKWSGKGFFVFVIKTGESMAYCKRMGMSDIAARELRQWRGKEPQSQILSR